MLESTWHFRLHGESGVGEQSLVLKSVFPGSSGSAADRGLSGFIRRSHHHHPDIEQGIHRSA
jgi:hypothetical protein